MFTGPGGWGGFAKSRDLFAYGSMAVELEAPRAGKNVDEALAQSTQRLSRIGIGLRSISSLQSQLSAGNNIACLNLHANSITRLECLDALACLKELNISSNCLVSLQGLPQLQNLQILNLASNQLKSLNGMCSLPNLSKLVLAHNYLTDLEGIEALQVSHCLQYIYIIYVSHGSMCLVFSTNFCGIFTVLIFIYDDLVLHG